MKTHVYERLDYILLICSLFISIIGITFIYSAAINQYGILSDNSKDEYIKQIVWLCIGFVAMIFAASYDYRKLERYSFHLFAGMIAVLILTKLFGTEINGSRSWIGIGSLGIQPAEISKIVFIIMLAKFLQNSEKEKERIRFFKAVGLMLVPIGLILILPDIGTASVFFPIFIIMCFMANVPVRYLVIVISALVLAVWFAVLPSWQKLIYKKDIVLLMVLTNNKLRLLLVFATFGIAVVGILGQIMFKKKYYYWITAVAGIFAFALSASYFAERFLVGKEYLRTGDINKIDYKMIRLIIFTNPYALAKGSGWNIVRSMSAIGSGGVIGQGYLKGIQTHAQFLPVKSSDFIFSVFSEEMGFAGGILLFTAYLIILIRIIYIIKQTTSPFSCYIASGILAMYFFHITVNIGMALGIMPITGIPLPFMSYGGSSMITNMIAMGLLMSINSRRLDFKAAF